MICTVRLSPVLFHCVYDFSTFACHHGKRPAIGRRERKQHTRKIMPRKRKEAGATAVADSTVAERPPYIDGPPTTPEGEIVKANTATAVAEPPAEQANGQERPQGRNWGNPYKPIFASNVKGFEMGENRRFKQRVFMFKEKPSEEILAALKEAGFTYRASEKAWTIHADAETRRLSDELAQQFAGESAAVGMSR
jgi:hypothetical protein